MLLSFHNHIATFQWTPIWVLSVRACQPSGLGMHAQVLVVFFLVCKGAIMSLQSSLVCSTHAICSIRGAYVACVGVLAGITEVARCGEGQQESHGVRLLLVGCSPCL